MAINQIKAGATLNYVILALNGVVGLAYTPYMLRMMGQSEFGLYSLAASVIAYLTLLDFGFGNAIIRYTAKFLAEKKIEKLYSMFGMFAIVYSAIGIIAFVGGLILYYNIDYLFGTTLSTYELERTQTIVLLMVFNLAITFPLSIYGSIITAYENFVFLRIVQIARILLNTAVMICLLHFGYKALAMVVVQTIFNIATLLLNYIYCRYKIQIKLYFKDFDWSFLKEIAIYSFWIFLNAIMDRIYWSTGQFVLGATSGTIAVSVFAVAISLQAIYMSFSIGITGVLMTRVTAMISRNCTDREMSNIFIKTGRIQFIILSFILSGVIVFGRQFIGFWAGKGYEDSYVIALLFLIPLTVPLIQNLGISILQARNQMRFRCLLYIIIAFASLALQIPLAKLYGGIGCAIAIAGALTIGHIIVMNIYYQKVQKLDIVRFWIEIGKMLIVPMLICAVSFFAISYIELNTINKLVLAILIFSIIYIPLFWKISMNDYERNLLWSPIKKIVKRIL